MHPHTTPTSEVQRRINLRYREYRELDNERGHITTELEMAVLFLKRVIEKSGTQSSVTKAAHGMVIRLREQLKILNDKCDEFTVGTLAVA